MKKTLLNEYIKKRDDARVVASFLKQQVIHNNNTLEMYNQLIKNQEDKLK